MENHKNPAVFLEILACLLTIILYIVVKREAGIYTTKIFCFCLEFDIDISINLCYIFSNTKYLENINE